MAISLTPSQLKTICPDAPAHAMLPLNVVLARTGSITPLPAAMLVAQLAAAARRRGSPSSTRPLPLIFPRTLLDATVSGGVPIALTQ